MGNNGQPRDPYLACPGSVCLMSPGRRQGDEHGRRSRAQECHVAAQAGLAAAELLLLDKAIEDTFCGVSLLERSPGVGLKPPGDQVAVGIHPRARTGLALPVARRLTHSQGFPNGLPRELQMAANLPDRPAIDPMLLADELHIDHLEHYSFPLPPAHLASAYREPISRWSTFRRALTLYWSTFRLANTDSRHFRLNKAGG
jgi:hypothetical protein